MSSDEPAFFNNPIAPLSQAKEEQEEAETKFENEINSFDESERMDSEERDNVTSQEPKQCTQTESEATRSLEVEDRVAALSKELEDIKVNYENEKREKEDKEQRIKSLDLSLENLQTDLKNKTERIDMHARDNAKLKEENQNYQKEIIKLQDERNRYKNEKKRLEEDNNRYKKDTKKLEKLEVENSRYQNEKKKLEEEISSLNKQLGVAKGLVKKLKDELQHTKEEADKRHQEYIKWEAEITKNEEIEKAKLTEVLKENEEWKKDVTILSGKKLALEEALDRKLNEYKSIEKASKIAEKQFETARKNYEARLEELQKQLENTKRNNEARIKELWNLKGKAEKEALERQQVIENKDRDLWQRHQQIQHMQSQIQSHISTINSLDNDKKDLTLRLSKLAGANLTYNNPNIADLSDENRPTKLAEEFSELYDNEWTDAFEAVEMENEKDKTQFMLKLLERVSNLCHDTSQDHMTAIKESFVSLNVRNEGEEEEIVDENCISETTSHGDEANADEGVPQMKPLMKAGTENSVNNTEGNPESNVEQVLVGHPPKTDTPNTDTRGRLATGEHLTDNTKANDSVICSRTDPENKTKERDQDSTQTADENKENGANVDEKDPLRKSKATRESSNQAGEGECHSANNDGNTEGTDKQTVDERQLETVTDTNGSHATGDLSSSQSEGNDDDKESSINKNAQNDATDQAQKKASDADENDDTYIEDRNTLARAHNLALESHQAYGDLNLMEELAYPAKVYKNSFSDDDSMDLKPNNVAVQANEISDNNPGGQKSSNHKTSDPKSPQTDKEKRSDLEQRHPVGTKTQTNGASKRCSRRVQTSLYTKLNDADYEKLTNEQKKIILEIRKVFEHQLSDKFHKIGTEIIVKEFKIEKQESLVKYVQKCMTICWSMCRHEPPVHIHFPDTQGELPYDTNMFKAYTKTGKHLDFVVWPALYLHKGGPMLAKGVAQGRK